MSITLNEQAELLMFALKKLGCEIFDRHWGDEYVSYTDYWVHYKDKTIAEVDTLDNDEFDEKNQGKIDMCFEALEILDGIDEEETDEGAMKAIADADVVRGQEIEDLQASLIQAIEYLEAIADPVKFLQDKADKERTKLDGIMVNNLLRNPDYYQSMAKEALEKLTPNKKENDNDKTNEKN